MLVLSLFPGIGLLDMAFEEEGFCIVRGPDLLWGGDVRRFHPPAGKFDGVIGGPPCQAFSRLSKMAGSATTRGVTRHGDMIPEFVRVVEEARPLWFLMENVREAPQPHPDAYDVTARLLSPRWLGDPQSRIRRFSFGVDQDPYRSRWYRCQCCEDFWCRLHWQHAHDCPCPLIGDRLTLTIDELALEPVEYESAVPAGHAGGRVKPRVWSERARIQGLDPAAFKDSPFTAEGLQRMIGNGVPLPMGRAIARAVKRVLKEANA